MVTEPRDVSRSRDTRNGHGVAGRFRPLGTPDEGPDPSPPAFAAAAWGYRRAEVDAWASWVAGLVAHGRNETVRADSAEATLRAALDRLERLEQPSPSPDDACDLPRRAGTPGAGAGRARDPRPLPHTTASITRAVDPEAGADEPDAAVPPTASTTPTAEHGVTSRRAPRPDADDPAPRPDTAAGVGEAASGPRDDDAPTPRPTGEARTDDAARLQIVESTLCEVMRLLHRLVGPETSTDDPEPSPADP